MTLKAAASDLDAVTTFNPTVAEPATSLFELLEQWTQWGLRHWPVTNEAAGLLGIISETDLADVVLGGPQARCQIVACPLQELTAGDVMSTEIIAISRWDSPLNALYLLLTHPIRSLPVLADDQLVGMVTVTDFLREFSYGGDRVSRRPVSDFVAEPLETIDCDLELTEALAAIEATGGEFASVTNGHLPLGAVSRRELRGAACRRECRKQFGLAADGPVSLRELAASSPTVRPGAKLSEAARLMVEQRRHAVAVVTQAGRMVGVVSETTVLRALAGSCSSTAEH